MLAEKGKWKKKKNAPKDNHYGNLSVKQQRRLRVR